MPKPFGEWLDEKIKQIGSNPRQVARSIKKTPTHLYRIIGGDVGASPELLRDLADSMGIGRAEIFRAWGEAEGGEEIGPRGETEYIVNLEDLTPEGYDDYDGTPQINETARKAATKAAKETYMTVSEAIRTVRRESPGTVPGAGPVEPD